MEDELLTILEGTSLPVIRQGSLTGDYPDTFITFWNVGEEEESAYDNEDVIFVAHRFFVNVYSTDPDTTYSLLRTLRSQCKANGWTIEDRGHDVASDEITHTGRGMTVSYLRSED